MSSEALALYGAILSTLAMAWNFWRAWQERRRLTTSYNLRGIEDEGNDVIVINHSPKPVTIYSPVLFWGRRVPWLRRYARTGVGDFEGMDTDTGITIDPFKMTVLNYAWARHFSWRHRRRPKAKLYLELSVVGRRRPLVLFVYDPNGWQPSIVQRAWAGITGRRNFDRCYQDENQDGDPII